MGTTNDLFVDRTPRHRRVTRWARRTALPTVLHRGAELLTPAVLALAVIAVILASARAEPPVGRPDRRDPPATRRDTPLISHNHTGACGAPETWRC